MIKREIFVFRYLDYYLILQFSCIFIELRNYLRHNFSRGLFLKGHDGEDHLYKDSRKILQL